MQIVYETLPTNSVDLDHASVFTLACDAEDEGLGFPTIVDAIIDAGCIDYVDASGVVTPIHWGKTAPNEFGCYDVVVDLPKIDLPHLRCLWIAGVIDREYPAIPDHKCPECLEMFSPDFGTQTECSSYCNLLARGASPDGF
jgi:hypothetical protein